jgi:aminoglycoside phosphotransferase
MVFTGFINLKDLGVNDLFDDCHVAAHSQSIRPGLDHLQGIA